MPLLDRGRDFGVAKIHADLDKSHRGSITKAGNGHVRRVLVAASWHYRHKPRCGWKLRKPRIGQPASVVEHALARALSARQVFPPEN